MPGWGGADLLRGVFTTRQLPQPADLDLRGHDQVTLHARAGAVAREVFGGGVFVRGVVEVSNFCRENCHYCGMRRDNRGLARFRADARRLEEFLLGNLPSMVTDLNLQAGEDPVVVREVVLPVLRALRRETSLGLSVGLGTLDEGLYGELREAGAAIYILKFETADPGHYEAIRAPGTLEERVSHIRRLAARGWHVSSGFIAGLPGQTAAHRAEDFRLAASLPLCGCSVSPFVPGDDTPFAGEAGGDVELTLNCIAALRLMRPDWVIPAVSALNLGNGANGGAGYRRGLEAGANLVTMNLTPPGLREDYLIYRRGRYIMTEAILREAMAGAGLHPARTGLLEHLNRAPGRQVPEPAPAPAAGG